MDPHVQGELLNDASSPQPMLVEIAYKRSASIPPEEAPPAKKTKATDTELDPPQTIEIMDGSSGSSSEADTPTPNNNAQAYVHEGSVHVDVPAAVEMTREEEVAAVREKANGIIRKKKDVIAKLRTKLKDAQRESNVFRDYALAAEAQHETLAKNNKAYQDSLTKKYHDHFKSLFDRQFKTAEADHADKLQAAKDKFDDALEAKEAALTKKSTAKINRLNDQIAQKDEKIVQLENDLHDAKLDNRKTERELREQHKEEVKRLKPELADAVRQQKAEVRERDATIEKLTKQTDAAEARATYHEGEWRTAQARNDALLRQARAHSQDLLRLSTANGALEHEMRDFAAVKRAMADRFAAAQRAAAAEWAAKVRKQREVAQNYARAQVHLQRGLFLLRHQNERNNALVAGLRAELAAAKEDGLAAGKGLEGAGTTAEVQKSEHREPSVGVAAALENVSDDDAGVVAKAELSEDISGDGAGDGAGDSDRKIGL